MAAATTNVAVGEKLAQSPGRVGTIVFGVILVIGVVYAVSHLMADLSVEKNTSVLPYIFLGGALLIALGFEFVNGFHDTANAVATVIYTHSLEPHVAVAWSGLFNFVGVLVSSGAVAFAIVSLLPVELILQVGSAAGFAMVFALLVAAMIWNIGTWYFGLPASSSHTLIGSIIGVGITNQLMAVKTGTSGVDWGQATNIGKSLLFSPLVGFAIAGVLLLVAKTLIMDRRLYKAPEGIEPELYKEQADKDRATLEGIAKKHLHGASHEVTTEIGNPAEIILRMEKELNADAVVMGTHARKGLSAIFLGSVADAVLRGSSCPVIAIRHKV